ncbi:MAG: glutathione S-transferase C-terminal domain-containing protein [Myxococcales bacterium]|nr:glutathione S-transferase C-terminal domain-containing protein [Myxococcales bacterium]
MGMLVEGKWRDPWEEPDSADGRYRRPAARFRGRVIDDPAADHPAKPGRYCLYVSLACPWSHRVLLARKLLGLEDVIGVSIVDPELGADGWSFSSRPGCIPDRYLHATYLHQLYTTADPRYTGRATVPLLWDIRGRTIVSNESADIVRMLGDAFARLSTRRMDLYPEALREEIDELNGFVHENVNEAVYRAGLALTQEVYDEAVSSLFSSLDELEGRLHRRPYLCGDRPTEADWRLFATAVRFDVVYYGLFKCNIRHWWDYRRLWAHLRDLYKVPGVAETVRLDHVKDHYYRRYPALHASGIVPAGPEIDFSGDGARG